MEKLEGTVGVREGEPGGGTLGRETRPGYAGRVLLEKKLGKSAASPVIVTVLIIKQEHCRRQMIQKKLRD